MIIGKNKVVTLTYRLEVDGELIDQSQEGKPLQFIQGLGQLIPGFEKNLEGLSEGDEYSFTVSPEEGYGEVDEQAIIEVDKELFVVDGELVEQLQVGAIMPMRDNAGNTYEGKVVKIGLDKVTLDFNHPLAGKNLDFSGKILEVREATSEELAHGHVH